MDFEAQLVLIWRLLLKKEALACFLVKYFAQMFPPLLELETESPSDQKHPRKEEGEGISTDALTGEQTAARKAVRDVGSRCQVLQHSAQLNWKQMGPEGRGGG